MTNVAPHLTAGFWCRSPGSPSHGSLVLCASSSARSTIGCFPRSSWAAGCSFWPCCLRGSDLGKSDSDARWSECQRRRLRVRPRYRPGTFLRLRHANGGGVHAIGQYRRAPDLGLPRWVSYLGYLMALVLLVAAAEQRWTQLVFPSWVLLVSLAILFVRQPSLGNTLEVDPDADT
jgi:hypothetical protein